LIQEQAPHAGACLHLKGKGDFATIEEPVATSEKGCDVTQEKPEARAHVVISGRVQGVNFRYHTVQMAQRLQVAGWVRNRADGTVEAVFQGSKGAVESMNAWCRKGPPAASVDNMDVEWEEPTEEFSGFNIRF
jgi:acylphosphatase